VRSLLLAQTAYAVAGLVALTVLFAAERPRLLLTLPLIVVVVGWTFRMTFEPESPLIDPEHLYRRPVFLLLVFVLFAAMVTWAAA
jgi:hypothetical protein